MSVKIKIALIGKLRSGKSSAADYLVSKYGFTAFAFGDEVKRVTYALYGDKFDRKPRALLQKVGQTCREAFGQDIWVDLTFRKIETQQPDRVLVSDLRQYNEYERLCSKGYVFIRIDADERLRIKRSIDADDDFTVYDLNHETERYIESFKVDYEVNNNGTVGELEAKLDQIMAEVLRIG